MQGLIAKKIGMTRVVDEMGQMVPVTILKIENQKITKILTPENDGYSALQVGYYEKAEKALTKADVGRLKKVQLKESFTRFKEFPVARGEEEGLKVGAALSVSLFEQVSNVDVTGITKGHGFEGAITRWGHKTGRRTHGSHFHRRPGSLGQRTTPGRVYKNKKMPGHMGNAKRTVQNLKVFEVDVQANIIAIKGSVPGYRDGFVIVRPSCKIKKVEKN